MSKWLVSLSAVGATLLSVFLPAIQSWEGAHPTITAVIAGAGVVIAHILPSPTGAGNGSAK